MHGARDVAQQDDRVVVSAVERDPGEGAWVGLGPTSEEGRLAVPGRRDHGHEGGARCAQLSDHARLRNRPGPSRWRAELDLDEVERSVGDPHLAPILRHGAGLYDGV